MKARVLRRRVLGLATLEAEYVKLKNPLTEALLDAKAPRAGGGS